jgi:hypothetical protein
MGGNGYCLMVEGGVLAPKVGGMAPWVRRRHKPGGGGAPLGRSACGGRSRTVPGGQGEKGGAGLVGQGVGWWAGRLGPAGRPRPKEWAGRLGWKKKKKEIHSKLISRFRKMDKEIRVTEIIGKNPKNSQKIVENLGRQEYELE